MSVVNDELAFNEALCARVKELRSRRGWTSAQMAIALGLPPERYRKYESRSPLPPYLMQRFALIANTSIEYLLTGRAPKGQSTPADEADAADTFSKAG